MFVGPGVDRVDQGGVLMFHCDLSYLSWWLTCTCLLAQELPELPKDVPGDCDLSYLPLWLTCTCSLAQELTESPKVVPGETEKSEKDNIETDEAKKIVEAITGNTENQTGMFSLLPSLSPCWTFVWQFWQKYISVIKKGKPILFLNSCDFCFYLVLYVRFSDSL